MMMFSRGALAARRGCRLRRELSVLTADGVMLRDSPAGSETVEIELALGEEALDSLQGNVEKLTWEPMENALQVSPVCLEVFFWWFLVFS